MKSCPFCAEEIHDAAIKCKHCGSDLAAAEEANTEAEAEAVYQKGVGIFLSLIGTGVFGFVAYRAFSFGETTAGAILAATAVAFFFLGQVAFYIGNEFRRAVMPDVIYARNASDLMQKKMFWELGPQSIGVFILFALAFYGLMQVIDRDTLNLIVDGKR